MELAQIAQLVEVALPGSRLREVTALGLRTRLLSIGEQRRAILRLPDVADPAVGDPLHAEALALRTLAAEIDLPIPEVLAAELSGPQPWLLLSYREGVPLDSVIDQLSEDERYAIGGELGRVIARVHAYTAPQYGPLDPQQRPTLSRVVAPPVAPAEPKLRLPLQRLPADTEPTGEVGRQADPADMVYLLNRIGASVAILTAAGEWQPEEGERLLAWLSRHLAPTGQAASLVHGDLAPEQVLVRKRDHGWALSGLIGWSHAQTWRPAWDHVVLQGALGAEEYFGVRVGYGNAYDDATPRRYDQLRDYALLPYRLALYLEAGRTDLVRGVMGSA